MEQIILKIIKELKNPNNKTYLTIDDQLNTESINILKKLVKKGLIHVLILNSKNILTDVFGNFEDNKRLTEYFIKKEYDELKKMLSKTRFEKNMSTKKILQIIGQNTSKNTLLKTCYDNTVQVYSPDIASSVLGIILWELTQNNDYIINTLADFEEIILKQVWSNKKTLLLSLGDGYNNQFFTNITKIFDTKINTHYLISEHKTNTPDFIEEINIDANTFLTTIIKLL